MNAILDTIRGLWQQLAGALTKPISRGDEALDLWLNGQSIAQVAAQLHPGEHGPAIVMRQRSIEAKARKYIGQLEVENTELKKQVAKALAAAAVNAQRARQAAEQAPVA